LKVRYTTKKGKIQGSHYSPTRMFCTCNTCDQVPYLVTLRRRKKS
jgi:hypothetical protein